MFPLPPLLPLLRVLPVPRPGLPTRDVPWQASPTLLSLNPVRPWHGSDGPPLAPEMFPARSNSFANDHLNLTSFPPRRLHGHLAATLNLALGGTRGGYPSPNEPSTPCPYPLPRPLPPGHFRPSLGGVSSSLSSSLSLIIVCIFLLSSSLSYLILSPPLPYPVRLLS